MTELNQNQSIPYMIEVNKLQSHARAFAEFESVQQSTSALKALQNKLQVKTKKTKKRGTYKIPLFFYHKKKYKHTHTDCCSGVVGTGDCICNSFFDCHSSLVHYAMCPLARIPLSLSLSLSLALALLFSRSSGLSLSLNLALSQSLARALSLPPSLSFE